MNRAKFLIRMDKAKNWVGKNKDGHFVCCALDMKLNSPNAVRAFQELFKPNLFITVFFRRDEANPQNPILPVREQKALRMTAILLFEEICLSDELYLDF